MQTMATRSLTRNLLKNESNNNKYAMTDPKGNSEFCFLETINVPLGENNWRGI